MATRPATKAGSWYVRDPEELEEQLDEYLGAVPANIDGSALPVPGARIIIAPHAGFDYSGPCAAWAYSCLDLSKAKRIFLLGPSHTYYLSGCAVTTFGKYATPFGDLVVDREAIDAVRQAGRFDTIPPQRDADEHSLEMHTPYIYKTLKKTFGSPDKFPPIVPILIGDNDRAEEKQAATAFVPYLKDPENAFIISSDFCHWGGHFSYMVYSPDNDPSNLRNLRRNEPAPVGPPIHETIRLIDEAAMDAVESGSHDAFVDNLKLTGNTVCGRHPIGVAMAGLEHIRNEQDAKGEGKFKIVQYQRSQLVKSPRESSVSYVSAYAVL
ncbi:unnamed protein product [Clonostachys byssicola]|uniref:Protein MEMO1 n=1 Tax=Clonostachys byssicola TaxID=160290 RepID=A0A9N9Y2X1_9HYPO|nr:unnamed protein product [Clonostachys byssicola]